MNIDMFAAGADRMHDDEAENSYDDLTEYDAIGMGPDCPQCGRSTSWLICWECFGSGGWDGEELTDEDPLWYNIDDWEECEECHGKGGWWKCFECKKIYDKLEAKDG